MYVVQNKWSSHKAVIRNETLAERYFLPNSLLLGLNATVGKESTVLTIPESCADRIINLYHSNIFGGHESIIKTYSAINENNFIPD